MSECVIDSADNTVSLLTDNVLFFHAVNRRCTALIMLVTVGFL